METDDTPGKKTPDEVVSFELPAPSGWKKKFTPKKGGTPRRNDIIFISPTGEEIKTKRQLELYLKSHPGGPSASEFDWGTGDTPRRSARLSDKSWATESSEIETPKKKQKRLSSQKGAKDKSDADDEGGAAVESKGTAEVPTADAEDAGERDDTEVVIETDTKDAEQKAEEGEEVAEEVEAGKDYVDVKVENKSTEDATMTEVAENTNKDEVENQEDGGKHAESKSLPSKEGNDKVSEIAPGGPETPSLAVSCEAAGPGQVSVAINASGSELVDALAKQPTNSHVGQIDQSSQNACDIERVESAGAVAADTSEAEAASKGNQDVSSS